MSLRAILRRRAVLARPRIGPRQLVGLLLTLLLPGCAVVHSAIYVEATKADEAGNYEKAARLYRVVATAENFDGRQAAQFRLAEMHLSGIGVAKNPQEALRLYRQATEGPDKGWRRLANSTLARFAEEGLLGHVARDRVKAIEFYRKAIEDGDKLSAAAIARLTRYPEVFVALNPDEFRHRGVQEAPAGIQMAYDNFKAGDHGRAFNIFLWHARNGNAEAQAAVAIFYRNGLAVARDPQRDIAWTYLAARNGNARAQLDLGIFYRNTDLVPVDDDEAEKWLSAASKQGLAEATNLLGVLLLYPYMESRRPDPAGAVRYFRQAAEAGSTHALTNLGDAYLEGVGVPKDRERAKMYFVAAAERGHVVARQRLFEQFDMVVPVPRGASARSPEVRRLEEKGSLGTASPVVPNPARITPVELYASLTRSVLRLYALNPGEGSGAVVSQGSAVAVTRNLALTNCHLLEGKRSYGARSDKGVIVFSLVALDRPRDLCVIRGDRELVPVGSVRRYETLKVGEKVYAIGSPGGLENTLSEGIISGLRAGAAGRLIQTTAAITKGSSGGGLFDEHGRLIGITTFRVDASGSLNFAVAVDEALEVLGRVGR